VNYRTSGSARNAMLTRKGRKGGKGRAGHPPAAPPGATASKLDIAVAPVAATVRDSGSGGGSDSDFSSGGGGDLTDKRRKVAQRTCNKKRK